MLEKYATGPTTYRLGSGGKIIVVTGSWFDAFSGKEFNDVSAKLVQIDHVVPVQWACEHGADTWSREKRHEFFNDMDYLMVVGAGINGAKGARGPDEFLPWKRDLACDYVKLFLDGVRKYDLRLSSGKRLEFLGIQRDACIDGPLIN